MVPGQRRFLVQKDVPELTSDDLNGLNAAVVAATRRLRADGHDVACLHSTYVPATEQWIGVFAAETADSVRRAMTIAQLPAEAVHEAITMTVVR
jgi:hypothetical protein